MATEQQKIQFLIKTGNIRITENNLQNTTKVLGAGKISETELKKAIKKINDQKIAERFEWKTANQSNDLGGVFNKNR